MDNQTGASDNRRQNMMPTTTADWTIADGNLPSDLLCMRTAIANICFIGKPGESSWLLVDAGVKGFADPISRAAVQRYGDVPPRAIVLTHGHFDHVGSLKPLLDRWNVPVYAHEAELPYLTGEREYPPADPTVGGGLMALISPLYPNDPIDIRDHARALPGDGVIPELPEWRWLHTPGHTVGHVSLFRPSDSSVIAGDAFITVKQESAWAVITQVQEIHCNMSLIHNGNLRTDHKVRTFQMLFRSRSIIRPALGTGRCVVVAQMAER